VGNTTRTALGDPDCRAAAVAARADPDSKANGSLMRATPLGVWAHRLSAADAFSAGVMDSMLTHPTVAGAGGAYVCAIAHLVAHPGDADGALAAVEAHLVLGSFTETLAWLHSIRTGDADPCHPNAGFAKIAFTHAFRHLMRRTPFSQALAQTLAGGGDTDTNAAIVGGLMGALHGAAAIPDAMIQPLLLCDTSKAGGQARNRPAWLHARRLPELAEQLLSIAPAVLQVRPESRHFQTSQERLTALMRATAAAPDAWDGVVKALHDDARFGALAARAFVQPYTGRTLLHAAAAAASRPACRLLISRGASLHTLDAAGKRPAELCPDPALAADLMEATRSGGDDRELGAEDAHYMRASSFLWRGATAKVCSRSFPVKHPGHINVRAGEKYYVDAWGRVLVGWHGSVSPPCGMDGEPMVDDA
jgi:ADP-ribosylglycohydrolase